MKGDVYFLRRDEDNYVTAVFVVEESTEYYVTGTCYAANSWCGDDSGLPFDISYVAGVYCKWDSCTHWYFRGEDYSIGNDECYGYYHLCGGWVFNDHIRDVCFVWRLVSQLMDELKAANSHCGNVTEEYFEVETTRKLVDLMLDGYRIEKASDKEAEIVRELM